MRSEWNEVEEVLEGYYHNREKILSRKQVVSFWWDYFFAPTILGQRSYRKERQLIEKEVRQRLQVPEQLQPEAMALGIHWHSIKIMKNVCHVSFVVQNTYCCQGRSKTPVKTATYHRVKLVCIAGRWYIEEDRYANEFEGIPEDESQKKGKKAKKQMRIEAVSPKGPYDREKATAYAKKYATTPNLNPWQNYTQMGGDCTNFVSQCLYAGGIPFDNEGKTITEKWYWYSDNHRTPSWTGADAFKAYVRANKGTGLVATEVAMEELVPGDIVQLGTREKATHSMIVVDVVYNEDNPEEVVDLLVAQHSSEGGIFGYNIPLSSKPPKRLYYKILGYNPQYT